MAAVESAKAAAGDVYKDAKYVEAIAKYSEVGLERGREGRRGREREAIAKYSKGGPVTRGSDILRSGCILGVS